MMLLRATERKLRRDAFRSVPTRPFEQSTCLSSLPWPRPAHSRQAATMANSHDARKQRAASSSHFASRHDSRSLATAAETHLPSPSSGFGHHMMPPWSTRQQPSHLTKLDHFDPTQTLVLREPSTKPTSNWKYGIGGDPTELYQNLYACLRVGLMDRAQAIIDRLAKMYIPSSPEVVESHNLFLRALFDYAEQNPTPESFLDIEQWYQRNMVQNAIGPTADTLITLLRASINFLGGYSRSAALTRYLTMAHQCGPHVVDTINESDEFTEEEWDVLIRAQSDKYNTPPPPVADSTSTPILGYDKLVEHGFLANPAHNINPVEQRGFGLQSLMNSLALFDNTKESVPFPHDLEGSQEDKERAHAFARQLRIETDSMNAALERWKAQDEKLQDIGIHGVLKSKPIQALMWQWYKALLPLCKEEMARAKDVVANPNTENLRDDRHLYGPYLANISADKLAALTISRVIQSCARGTHAEVDVMRVASLTTAIGDDIEQEYQLSAQSKFRALQKKTRRLVRARILEQLKNDPGMPEQRTRIYDDIEAQTNVVKYSRTEFPLAVKTALGAVALEMLLKSAALTHTAKDPKTGALLTNTQPAFHHRLNFYMGKRVGFLAPHADLLEKLHTDSVHSITTRALPMVCEPKPWVGLDEGGFYETRSTAIRTKSGDHAQRAYAHTAISNGDMDKVLGGLDVLGRVPWQINKDVFEVMVDAWNTDEAIGGMASPKSLGEPPAELASDATDQELGVWMNAMKEWENKKSGLHSQRCFQNFQLEIARAYLGEKKIFFPHNIDFRGRAYPIPPLLNHIGADLARGMLRFANGKELGSVGLQWLKIQLANLYGFDKASLREREQFAMDHLSDIYDSATDPLNGKRWWTQAEDPWQCLACCMELKNALDSPDPTRYVSQLPVHQDGTCNGLQHYAALGGDHAGATQVNLEPSDRPQDIYTGVAELVKDMIAKDAANGRSEAIFLKDKITRKVVKRTVMTNVYGVTFMGAKLQVLQELHDAFPNFTPTKEVRNLGKPALYIVSKIFMALGQIFNGAQEIQYWLGECGDRITTSLSPEQIKRIKERHDGVEATFDAKFKPSKGLSASSKKRIDDDNAAFKTSIIWTTPLKMPVVQPYRKDNTEPVKTSLQVIMITKYSKSASVNKRKQLQAFPPNFIHSLDASHMLLSALKCSEMGLDFAAVHDSFWTHAADIPTLNVILRDAFVRMHSEDIMGRLAAEFQARYKGHIHKAEILSSSEPAKLIQQWRRARMSAKGKARVAMANRCTVEEVALEATRQELLNSEDPELRKKGEEMVTPTSIWLAHGDPKAFASRRLALLGETKAKMQDQVKDKIMGAEAEATKSNGQSSSEDLQAADSSPESVVKAAIEAESQKDLDSPSAMDPQKEASLAGITETSIQSIKQSTAETLAEDELDMEEEMEEEEEEDDGEGKPAKSKYTKNHTQVWIPLSFPPPPKKGTWDVARLHKSQYFFS